MEENELVKQENNSNMMENLGFQNWENRKLLRQSFSQHFSILPSFDDVQGMCR